MMRACASPGHRPRLDAEENTPLFENSEREENFFVETTHLALSFGVCAVSDDSLKGAKKSHASNQTGQAGAVQVVQVWRRGSHTFYVRGRVVLSFIGIIHAVHK